jgi:hypothetical protein
MKKSKLKLLIGEKVKLLPFEDEPEEYGELLSVEGSTAVVCLEEKYREDKFDDGLREVEFDQLEEIN